MCVVEWVCVLGLSYHSVSLIHYTIMIVPLSGLTHLTPTNYLYIVISLGLMLTVYSVAICYNNYGIWEQVLVNMYKVLRVWCSCYLTLSVCSTLLPGYFSQFSVSNPPLTLLPLSFSPSFLCINSAPLFYQCCVSVCLGELVYLKCHIRFYCDNVDIVLHCSFILHRWCLFFIIFMSV